MRARERLLEAGRTIARIIEIIIPRWKATISLEVHFIWRFSLFSREIWFNLISSIGLPFSTRASIGRERRRGQRIISS